MERHRIQHFDETTSRCEPTLSRVRIPSASAHIDAVLAYASDAYEKGMRRTFRGRHFLVMLGVRRVFIKYQTLQLEKHFYFFQIGRR